MSDNVECKVHNNETPTFGFVIAFDDVAPTRYNPRGIANTLSMIQRLVERRTADGEKVNSDAPTDNLSVHFR
jgi:hypothetical protein